MLVREGDKFSFVATRPEREWPMGALSKAVLKTLEGGSVFIPRAIDCEPKEAERRLYNAQQSVRSMINRRRELCFHYRIKPDGLYMWAEPLEDDDDKPIDTDVDEARRER